MKKALQKIINLTGYKLSKNQTPKNQDPFKMQVELIQKAGRTTADPLVIFDIGAFIGNIAKEYKTLFPNAAVHCFEPFPESYQRLLENVKGINNILPNNFGMADFNGTTTFNSNKSAPTNSLLSTHQDGAKVWGDGLLDTVDKVEVKMETLDNYCAQHQITSIDIMKLDAQGAENLILKGGEKSLKNGVVKIIYTEILTLPTYENQVEFDEMLALFRSMGFRLFNVYNLYSTEAGQLGQMDAIFVHESFNSKGLI